MVGEGKASSCRGPRVAGINVTGAELHLSLILASRRHLVATSSRCSLATSRARVMQHSHAAWSQSYTKMRRSSFWALYAILTPLFMGTNMIFSMESFLIPKTNAQIENLPKVFFAYEPYPPYTVHHALPYDGSRLPIAGATSSCATQFVACFRAHRAAIAWSKYVGRVGEHIRSGPGALSRPQSPSVRRHRAHNPHQTSLAAC